MTTTQSYVDRIGRLVLDWAGYPEPEKAADWELEELIDRLGESSVPEACGTVGDTMRDHIYGT